MLNHDEIVKYMFFGFSKFNTNVHIKCEALVKDFCDPFLLHTFF